MKKLLPLLLLILIGCSSPEPERSGSERSEPEPINIDTMLIERNDVYYTKDTNKPYSGPVFTLYENGQLEYELTLRNGKVDGPFKFYDENGQLWKEGTYEDGDLIDVWYTDSNKSLHPTPMVPEEED